MPNPCVPIILAAKPAAYAIAQVARRIVRHTVGRGARGSHAAGHAKLATPTAGQAPLACAKGAGTAAMQAAALAGWLGMAGAGGYAAAGLAAAGAPSREIAAPADTTGVSGLGGRRSYKETTPAPPVGTSPGQTAQTNPGERSGTVAEPTSATPPRLEGPVSYVTSGEPFQPDQPSLSLPNQSSPLAPTSVAEPGSLALLAIGLLGLAGLRARARRNPPPCC